MIPHVVAGAADTFSSTAASGSLLLAVPVALVAGVVSFLSPCVLPLVPGYLSYVTGLTGADLAGADLAGEARPHGPGAMTATPPVATATAPGRHRGRILAGSLLFICGFSLVFVSLGAIFGGFGRLLHRHELGVARISGVVVIALGLAFLGVIPGLQREMRLHRLPAAGLAGAFPLGFAFGLGWTPCIGPTLGAVQVLAVQDGTAARGALLTFVYCLGLGLPFIAVGLLFRRAVGVLPVLRRHSRSVMRVGGIMLITVGVLLVAGVWNDFTIWLRVHLTSTYTPAV